MGNGSGLKDLALTLEDLEKAAQSAASSFGRPNFIFLPPNIFNGGFFKVNPEYAGTDWEDTIRLTKREHAVAKIHTTLSKLGIFKKWSHEEQVDLRIKSQRRLKRAKWARYQKEKV